MDQSAIPDGREGIDAADGRAALDRPTATPGWSSLSGITRALLLALTGIGLAYVGVCIYRHATTIIDAYDGSYNAMVARTVAFEHRYGVWDNREFIRWPVRVTTGPAMLLPMAAAYWCLGDWPFLPNVVTAGLCLGTLVLCWLLALSSSTQRSVSQLFSLSIAIAVLILVIGKYGGLYTWLYLPHGWFYLPVGDIFAGLLLLAATCSVGRMFRRGGGVFWAALSGILMGLAVNTKFIAILPVGALGCFLLVSAVCRGMPRAGFACWLLASAAVMLGFEIYRFMTLGSLAGYVDNLKEFLAFVRVGGSGLAAANPPLAQLVTARSQIFAAEYGWCGPVLLSTLFLAAPCMLQIMRGKGSADGWIGVACVCQAVPLCLWWFCYAGRDIIRPILPGLVLLPFACHFLISGVTDRLRSRAGRPMAILAWACLVAVACLVSPPGVWRFPKLDAESDSPAYARTVALQDFCAHLDSVRSRDPGARFWGAGWWRHWDVQIVSHVACLNLLAPPPGLRFEGGHDYLIYSDHFNWDHNPSVDRILERNRENIVFSNRVFRLYRLSPQGMTVAGPSVPAASHANPTPAG